MNIVVLTYYDMEEVVPGVFDCRYNQFGESFNSQTQALVGLRLNLDDGPHYGWIRFTRPDPEPSTPFTVAGFDYNPLPDVAIGAGLPPPPPPIVPVLDEQGLTLNWDSRFSGLVLEWTGDLSPPAVWKPVEGVSGSSVTFAVDSDQPRFFRLNRP